MAKSRCIHLDVPPTASGRVTVRQDYVYHCNFPLPEMPVLPVSVTGAWRYEPVSEKSKRRVSTDDCARCPLFAQVAK